MQNYDTCKSIESANVLSPGDVRQYNSWVEFDCSNLQSSTESFGRILCLGVEGGNYTAIAPIPGVTLSLGKTTGHAQTAVDTPSDATVAEGSTLECGR
jgi:hypothetical protein